MKKRKPTFSLLLGAVTLVLSLMLGACSGSPIEKMVKDAFLQGDTTQARFDSICSVIKANPDRYSDYVDENGEINIENLSKMIEEVGGSLRPPMHWNVKAYGVASYSLTVYFERSGSMVPYDQTSGGGQLKKAVNDLINYFPADEQQVSINIVNNDIYPYNGTTASFLQDRNIYESTRGTGDASFTDFQLIFDKIFKAQKPGNVSVLVTDLIYSPKNTADVSVEKILNEENSLATAIFKQYKGKSIIVNQLMGDFDGKYYPYNGEPFDYRGRRPFYVIVIADAQVMDRMAGDARFDRFLNLPGVLETYRFNQAQSQLKYKILPSWKDDVGRFRISRDKQGALTQCEGDRETGVLCFTVAAALNGLRKSDAFLTDVNNYTVQSHDGYAIKVRKVESADINGNNKDYLEGMSHLITIAGKPQSPRDAVTLSLRNDFPQWISKCTSRDDSHAGGDFAGTTFGLEQFLRGIYDAFTAGESNYATLTIEIEK